MGIHESDMMAVPDPRHGTPRPVLCEADRERDCQRVDPVTRKDSRVTRATLRGKPRST
jgi:hypothetical protein